MTCNKHLFHLLLLSVLILLSCSVSIAQDNLKTDNLKTGDSKTGDSKTADEINHLMDYIEKSGCTFIRNGKSYPSNEAVKHIQKKYNYLKKKNKIDSTEIFIKLCASESSMSGKPYFLECGDQARMKSKAWLETELTIYRKITFHSPKP